MFEEIGKKIKLYASILFWIGIIAALVIIFTVSSIDEDLAGMAIVYAIVCLVGSWIGSAFIYGFGELIDCTEENMEINKKILKILSTQQPTNATAHAENLLKDKKSAISENTSAIVCPSCKTEQKDDSSFCWKCGTPLKKNNTDTPSTLQSDMNKYL